GEQYVFHNIDHILRMIPATRAGVQLLRYADNVSTVMTICQQAPSLPGSELTGNRCRRRHSSSNRGWHWICLALLEGGVTVSGRPGTISASQAIGATQPDGHTRPY